ncbi:MAG TPA: GNAT family N-acetyltransferase [Kofleriaceae bacterium]|nr:GNAT family N-acetyltransferase [Kofleriaceae bacterium]
MEIVEIVPLGPDDWELYRDLRIAGLTEAPYAFSSTLDDVRALGEAEWRAKLESRAQFVARDGAGMAVGTVGAFPDGDGVELTSLWVDPRARGRGVGAALVERVIAHARARGCRDVRLAVAVGNATAERLYRRCGFLRTGVLQTVRPGEPELEAQMIRLL